MFSSHDVDFKEYSEELSRQDKNTNEREQEEPRNYREYNRKRRFHREEDWAEDYVQDFSTPVKHARTDNPYYDQVPQHSYSYTDQSHSWKSRHTRTSWNHSYDRRNDNPYERPRRDYQRSYDHYYSRRYGNHGSEPDRYENDYRYRWQRNDKDYDPRRYR